MTVLPQLELELLAAHGRRAQPGRRRPGFGWLATATGVACAIAVAVFALALGGHRRPTSTAGIVAGPRVLVSHIDTAQALAARGALFLANQTYRGNRPTTRLMSIDPRTGNSLSRILFGRAVVSDMVIAGRSLWVTTEGNAEAGLWRLDPSTLRVISHRVLPGTIGPRGSLATAGGWLWVGTGGRLDRIAPATGDITAEISIGGAREVQVAGDADGQTLIVSKGDGSGRGYVQRRDAGTGALLATSRLFLGVTEPSIGGIIDGGVWFSEATGMMGRYGRLDVRTLRPTRTQGPAVDQASNGIRAQVIDGILWVSQPDGGPQRNYCGNPATGQVRATLPAALQKGVFLTADTDHLYYLRGPLNKDLMAAPIDPRCR
jgi:streptogramin lyase